MTGEMHDWTSLLSYEPVMPPEEIIGGNVPLLATQTSLLDSDVPELVAPAVVEVHNSEERDGDPALGVTSTISISLLLRLVEKNKRQRELRRKRIELLQSIGVEGPSQVTNRGVRAMFAFSNYGEEEEAQPAADPLPAAPNAADGEAMETEPTTGEASGGSGLLVVPQEKASPIFSNPSQQAAASDSVEAELLADDVMRQRLEQMAQHRRSEADASDIQVSSVQPTRAVKMPIEAGDLLKRSRPENTDTVFFAFPTDGSAPFQIDQGTSLPTDQYRIEEYSREDAISYGLFTDKDFPMERARKKPMRYDNYEVQPTADPSNPSTALVPGPGGGDEEGEEGKEGEEVYDDEEVSNNFIEEELNYLRYQRPQPREVTSKSMPNAIKRKATDTAEERQQKELAQNEWRRTQDLEEAQHMTDTLAIQASDLEDQNMLDTWVRDYMVHNNGLVPNRADAIIVLQNFPNAIDSFLQRWPTYTFTRNDVEDAKRRASKVEDQDDVDNLSWLEGKFASYSQVLSDAETELEKAVNTGDDTDEYENKIRHYKLILSKIQNNLEAVHAAMQELPWGRKNEKVKRMKRVADKIEDAVKSSTKLVKSLLRPSNSDKRLSLQKVEQRSSGRRNPHVDTINQLVDRMKTAPVSERVAIEQEYEKQFDLYKSWIEEDDKTTRLARSNVSRATQLMKEQRKMESVILQQYDDIVAELDALNEKLQNCNDETLSSMSRELVQLDTDISATGRKNLDRLYKKIGYELKDVPLSEEQKRQVIALRKAELEAELKRCEDLKEQKAKLLAQLLSAKEQMTQQVFVRENLKIKKGRDSSILSVSKDTRTKRTEEQLEKHREIQRSKKARDEELRKRAFEEFGTVLEEDVARMTSLRDAEKKEDAVRNYIAEFTNAIGGWCATEQQAAANKKVSEDSLKALKERVQKEASELEKAASEQIRSLTARGRSALALKAWEEYTKSSADVPVSSSESGYDAIKRLDSEIAALKPKKTDCGRRLTKAAEDKKLAVGRVTPVETVLSDYRHVLSKISEFRISGRSTEYLQSRAVELVDGLKAVSDGQLTSFEQVESLVQERDRATTELEAIKRECRDVLEQSIKKKQERADLQDAYKRSALELYRQHAGSAAGSSASGDPDDSDIDKIANAIFKQRKAIELRKEVDDAERTYKNDYKDLQNAAAHERSSDPVIKQRGEDRKRKGQIRANIKKNFLDASLYKKYEQSLLDDVLEVLEYDKRKKNDEYEVGTNTFLEELKKNEVARKLSWQGHQEATDAYDKIVISKTSSKRVAPKALKGDQGESSSTGMLSIVYLDSDQERDATKSRHESYDESIQQMQFFALGGSTRALHFYALVAWYVNRFKLGAGTNGPQIVAVNSTFTQAKNPEELVSLIDPTNDVFTIKWDLVDAYKPESQTMDLANNLKYILAQWASLPLERRAGSHPDREEMAEIVRSQMASVGADGTPAVVDPITGELMVVTTDDKEMNDAMPDEERGKGLPHLSHPLGRLKRTPVTWVQISRNGQDSFVPVDDKLSIVRKRPGRAQKRMYPLHLTNDEALAEFNKHAAASQAERLGSGSDLYVTQVKWWNNDENGARYGELKADELTAAMWESILQSREHLATGKARLTYWEEQIAQLTQKKEEAYKVAAQDKVNAFALTAAPLANDADVLDVNLDDLPSQEDRLQKIPNYTMAGEMPENVRSIEQALVASKKELFETKLLLMRVYGLPMFRAQASPVLQSKVDDILARHSTLQTISTVAESTDAPKYMEDADGLFFFKKWVDNPVFFARVATFFNRFMSLFYPWERPIGDYEVDGKYMLDVINWMNQLRDNMFTYVVVQLHIQKDDQVSDVRCWFVDVVDTLGKVRHMGPGMTEPKKGVLGSTPFPRVYAETMDSDLRGVSSRLDDFEQQGDLEVSRKAQRQEWVDTHFQMLASVAADKRRSADFKQSGRDKLESDKITRLYRQASRNPMTYRMSPYANVGSETRTRKAELEEAARKIQQTQVKDELNDMVLGSSIGSSGDFDLEDLTNPMVEIVVARSQIASESMRFRIRSLIDNPPSPEAMNEILLAMRDKYSGQFATAIKVVEVASSDGLEEARVGTIVRLGQPYDKDIDEDSVTAIVQGSAQVYDKEFGKWLEGETKRQSSMRQLVVASSNAPLALPQRPVPGLPPPQSGQPQNPALALTDQSRGGRPDVPMNVDDDAGADAGADADAEAATDDELRTQDMLASADESDRKLLANADIYIRAIENTPAPSVEAAVMHAIMSMYDPGPLRPPVTVGGCLIRPLPLPDIEIEVA